MTHRNTSSVPFSPKYPICPPSGPTQGFSEGPPAAGNFLATRLSTLGLALAIGLSSAASASVVIDWVAIGDPGNAAQSAAMRSHSLAGGDGYGAVADAFRMARNETTIAQYTAFLSAVATTDPYNLYNPDMASDANIAGISRSGTSGNYTYSVIGSGDRPISYVSWFDAARFSNWMHNGQGGGDTETGAYTLNGATSGTVPARNVGATLWIPTENEWFKAAYYDPTHMNGAGGYWLYANQSDSMTSNDPTVAGAVNHRGGDYANTPGNNTYSPSQHYLTESGAYGIDSQNYYGLNDMSGNVSEWNDLTGTSGLSRGGRGGSWDDAVNSLLRSSLRGINFPTLEGSNIGFRVASIPEPSAMVLTLLFGAGLTCRRKR